MGGFLQMLSYYNHEKEIDPQLYVLTDILCIMPRLKAEGGL